MRTGSRSRSLRIGRPPAGRGRPDSGEPGIRCSGTVQLVKVGSKGQVLIVLRQAGVYPLEIYSEERIREFEEADRLSLAERRRLKALKR